MTGIVLTSKSCLVLSLCSRIHTGTTIVCGPTPTCCRHGIEPSNVRTCDHSDLQTCSQTCTTAFCRTICFPFKSLPCLATRRHAAPSPAVPCRAGRWIAVLFLNPCLALPRRAMPRSASPRLVASTNYWTNWSPRIFQTAPCTLAGNLPIPLAFQRHR